MQFINILKKSKYRSKSIIIQKYIENPLLYFGRKFDIRIWVLLTQDSIVYYFKEGHLKTSSIKFDIDTLDSYVHLTNYSIQKYNTEFAKFEIGNEVSFASFQNYLNINKISKNVINDIIPKIKKIIEISMKAIANVINVNKRENCFELFGYDFLVDTSFNVYLLEVNTNPGLDESSPLINILVPRMINDMYKLTIDKLFNNNIKKQEMKENANKDSNYDKINLLNCNDPEINRDIDLSKMLRIKELPSMFNVPGYPDDQNLWEEICDLRVKESCNSKVSIKLSSQSLSKIKYSRKE